MALLWNSFIMYYYSHLCYCCFPNKLFKLVDKTLKSTSNQYCDMIYKQEQVCDDHLWRSCSLFLIGIFHSSWGLVKYPYTKAINMISTYDHHELVLVIVCIFVCIHTIAQFVDHAIGSLTVTSLSTSLATWLFKQCYNCSAVLFHGSADGAGIHRSSQGVKWCEQA